MSYQWTGIIGKIVKIGAIVLIPISYLAMTYSNWWKAPAASLLIALLATIAWSRQGLSVIGLKIPSDQIGVSLLILFIVTAGHIMALGGALQAIAETLHVLQVLIAVQPAYSFQVLPRPAKLIGLRTGCNEQFIIIKRSLAFED